MSLRGIVVAALLVAGVGTVTAATPTRPPNIVILLADDLGRADLGYTGSDIRTPNLDKLAATGVKLDRFYACPVCSPTRAGLMTGRWPIRYGLMRTVIPPWSEFGLPLEERTLADALGEAGYAWRGIFGKWHLGHARRAFLPTRRGFTQFYGHYNGAFDYFTHEREGEIDWHRNDETVKEEGYATDLIGREAVRFVSEAPKDKPYFMYVPFNAPHSPWQAKEEDLAKYPNRQGNKKTYAAMVDSMDQAIGQILTAIENRGDAENTFILFFSDNGGPLPVAPNKPYRDGKFSVYEGGIRVVASVRWPAGGLQGGGVIKEPMGYIDVFPTALRVAGAQLSAKAPKLDGADVLDVMRGQKPLPERPWFSYIAPQTKESASIHLGPWKLVVTDDKPILGEALAPSTKVELYNIVDDPTEKADVAAQQPERVAELKKHLAEFGRMQTTGVAAYDAGKKGFKAPKDWIIEK